MIRRADPGQGSTSYYSPTTTDPRTIQKKIDTRTKAKFVEVDAGISSGHIHKTTIKHHMYNMQYTEITCGVGHGVCVYEWSSMCCPCEIGSEKYTIEFAACIACPSFSRLNKSLPHDMKSCQCLPGYTDEIQDRSHDSDDMCSPCPIGFFKSVHGNGACTACSGNKTTLCESSTHEKNCTHSILKPEI